MSWAKLAVAGLATVSLLVIWMTRQIWAAAFLGVLFALGLDGLGDFLRQRLTMPRWFSVLLAMMLVLLVLSSMGWSIGPSLARQIDQMIQKLPQATQNVVQWMDRRPWGKRMLEQAHEVTGVSPHELAKNPTQITASAPSDVDQPQNAPPPAQPESTPLLSSAGQMLKSIAGALSLTMQNAALVMVSLVVMVFVALDPAVYGRGLLWLVPRQHEHVAQQALRHLSSALKWWLAGRITSMAVVGILTSLGMWLIGMPAPLALGALAALLSFVPNVGPIIAAVPGLVLALGDGPWMTLWAACVYLGAQLVESHAITPLVEQYAVSLPAGILIVTQFVLATLAGAWGMVVATPLLVVAVVLIQQLYVREKLGKPIVVTGST